MSAVTLVQGLTSMRLPLGAFWSLGQTRCCRRGSSLYLLRSFAAASAVAVAFSLLASFFAAASAVAVAFRLLAQLVL